MLTNTLRTLAAVASAGVLALALNAQTGAPAQQTPPAAPSAAQPQPAKSPVALELVEIVKAVKAKLQTGKNAESDFTDELKSFDDLLAKHKAEKTEEVARIYSFKAMLYIEIFKNFDKGIEVFKQLAADFPDTPQGQKALETVAALEKAKARKAQADAAASQLQLGAVFPSFEAKDLSGAALSPDKYRGKVVLIDFWATWCPPCVAELPNVIAAYQKYHERGFEVIGISLDKDEAKLKAFIQSKGMTWQQYFDGKGWENELSTRFGIESIPATFLLDQNGKIVARDVRGEELEAQLAKLLPEKK